MQKPEVKPNHPFFSSGPCSKRPGWNLDSLKMLFLADLIVQKTVRQN